MMIGDVRDVMPHSTGTITTSVRFVAQAAIEKRELRDTPVWSRLHHPRAAHGRVVAVAWRLDAFQDAAAERTRPWGLCSSSTGSSSASPSSSNSSALAL